MIMGDSYGCEQLHPFAQVGECTHLVLAVMLLQVS